MPKQLSKKLAMFFFLMLLVATMSGYASGYDWYPMESGTEVDLYGVWGSAANNVFAVGDAGTILRYDGFQWSPIDSGVDEYTPLYGIWGFSGIDFYVGGYGPTLLHCDGLACSPVPWALESSVVSFANSFKYIWGESPTKLFIGGTQAAGPAQYGLFGRFDGYYFYPIPWIHGSETKYAYDVHDVWGFSSTNVYIPDGSPYYGYIWHYDGTACYTEFRTEIEGVDNTFYTMWGSAENDIFAASGSGRVYHFDGSTWNLMGTGITEYAKRFYGIWGTSGDDVYAVAGGTKDIFFHYDGATWSTMDFKHPSGILYSPMNDIWVSQDRKGFAVGSHGQIFGYNVVTTTTTTINPSSTTTTAQPCPAEEVYEEHSEKIEILRYLRDRILNRTTEGKELIKLYYEWSPVIVKLMHEDEEFKAQVKEMIDGVLILIGESVVE